MSRILIERRRPLAWLLESRTRGSPTIYLLNRLDSFFFSSIKAMLFLAHRAFSSYIPTIPDAP